MRKGYRASHCRAGHAFNNANTYTLGVKRFCRACGAIRALNAYHAKGISEVRKEGRKKNWRDHYAKNTGKHIARNAKIRKEAARSYIVQLIVDKHPLPKAARKAITENEQLIAAYRAQLNFKRLIHEQEHR